MEKAHLDFETRGAVDLLKVGAYRYVEDKDTDIWLFSWRLGSGPINRWLPGSPPPTALLEHIAAGGVVTAHNAVFERLVWNSVLRRTAGCESYPRLTIAQMDCTMSRSLAIHLPADLDTLAKALDLSEQKDTEGHTLMRKMAKPRKRNDDGTFVWWDDQSNIDRLAVYCDQDVLTECAVDARLPPLSADERRLWELDQKINDRGIALDLPTIHACVEVLEIAQTRAHARMNELTGGAVRKCSEALRIVEWLNSRGISATSIAKSEHGELKAFADLAGDDVAREVIELRAEAAKSSTAKYTRMLQVACEDGRARGLLAYHRAHTGRWGGALLQPQNLPSFDEDTDLNGILGTIDIMEDTVC